MTLFRVLSEEESSKVTRWRAPELDSETAVVANTRQQANPRQPAKDSSIRALLGSLDLKPELLHSKAAAPRLQSISPVDVFANSSVMRGRNVDGSESLDSNVHVSAELLQASYDEGYSKGYAEGNAALHQQLVKELDTIVTALTTTSTYQEDIELEHELVALSMEIARLVIRREISIAPEIMHNIVTAGLEQLVENSSVQQVFLHPLDANIVREKVCDDAVLNVFDDPLLQRGAVRIESGASCVNAGIEDWLHTVSAQLGLIADESDLSEEASISGTHGSTGTSEASDC